VNYESAGRKFAPWDRSKTLLYNREALNNHYGSKCTNQNLMASEQAKSISAMSQITKLAGSL
jgi:hypothetical protein